MYAAYLQFSGFRVAEAANGVEAIEKTHRAAARHRPDGPVAAADGRLGGDAPAEGDARTRHIPIVALTGHALAGHAEGRARGRMRRVRHQAVPARRARRRDQALARRGHGAKDGNGTRTRSEAQTRPGRVRAAGDHGQDSSKHSREGGQGRHADQAQRAAPRAAAAQAPSGRRAPRSSREAARAAELERRLKVPLDAAARRRVRRQVRLLHHPLRRAAELRAARPRPRAGGRAHRPLPGHRGRRLRHADGGPGSDARERARAPARQRDGDAEAHGDPDVVRHGVQDRRRHHRAAALGLRRVQRRAHQDAGQARVRPEGALGPRPDHPRDRGRGRGHPAAEERDLVAEGLDLLRAHAVRPADRRGAAVALGALRGRDLRRAARRLGGVAVEQADRRPHDHERRVPGLARDGAGRSTRGSRRSASSTTS